MKRKYSKEKPNKFVYEINEIVETDSDRELIALFYLKNGCCKDKPFVLTKHNGGYSCECGCNWWCTSLHKKAEDAISEYIKMSNGVNVFFANS